MSNRFSSAFGRKHSNSSNSSGNHSREGSPSSFEETSSLLASPRSEEEHLHHHHHHQYNTTGFSHKSNNNSNNKQHRSYSVSSSSSTSSESAETTPFLSLDSKKNQNNNNSNDGNNNDDNDTMRRLDENTSINIHDINYTSNTSYESMRRFVHEDEEITKEYDRRSFIRRLMDFVLRRQNHFGRTIFLNGLTLPYRKSYSPNVVRNQKYNIITFIPWVLFEQFKFFFNLYFLLVAITQFIPQLKVGFLFTYVAPLIFVLVITMAKEAYDDLKRWRRDVEANSQKYQKLTRNGFKTIPSSKIKVGDMIQIHSNTRVPADCILLRTTEKSGASFIRTDQLDGETDWKLRHAIPSCQKLVHDENLLGMAAAVYAEAPKKAIYDFIGTFTKYNLNGDIEGVESLSLENTMWANTVVASGTVIGLVIYTGKETRSVMNTSSPSSKVGKLDRELNTLSKFLFVLMILLSLVMVALKRFQGLWFITFFRFVLLFSSIIPISLRVNLDVGKSVYSFFMMRDKKIPGTIVRNSSIPEELGRIEYLFTDKTGTLTQNEMIFKKLNMGVVSFSGESLGDIQDYLHRSYSSDRVMNSERLVREMIEALALCHNVTPVIEGDTREYQASSPDEIALVRFSESVGISLEDRTLTTITIRTPTGVIETYEVLLIFPFTSQSKRMGIIVRNNQNGEITFYCKGADVIMTKIVKFSNWLDEECGNLALEGLRTLVFAKKRLTQDEFDRFFKKYNEAKAALQERAEKVEAVRLTLEQDMDLLGVTGVEDLLQEDVQKSLVEIRNAGIKVWMLTGDKVETAICIARSTRLVANKRDIFKVIAPNKIQAELKLIEFEQLEDTAMIIDGDTLQICLDHLKDKFVHAARNAPSVVCCRCAPTQKAAIVDLIKQVTKKRTAAIGDGGNDVSMIQAADVGLGIVGKEGRHASLAADFSINQFSYCTQLILWHGRNSYKRSARLSQFVIHRGLIISIIQAVFSAIYYFAAIPVFTGWLIVGYSTFYTMLPVLTIVFDEDVKREIAFTFPELYSELQLGRVLSFKTFLIWVWKAVYQGGVIMLLAIFLFENNFLRIQSISFTALILTELMMVVLEVHKVNILMILSEILSIGIYIGSVFLLPSYFDINFILSLHFWWKVIVIVVASCVPIYVVKFIQRRLYPPAWRKLA